MLRARIHVSFAKENIPPMRALWIADAHLSDPSSGPYRSLQELLHRYLEEMDCLVLLGDLFEIWVGDNAFLVSKHRPLLDLLVAIRKRGTEVFYLKGNHDFLLGDLISRTIGSLIFDEEAVFQWDGYRFFASHGDQVNKKDYGYRILKALLRSHWIERAVGLAGDSKSYWIAQHLARVARGGSSEKKTRVAQSLAFRYARDRLNEQYDAVILGHSHILQSYVFTVRGRRRVYLNPGSWSDSCTYLWYHEGKFQIFQHRDAQPRILFDFDFSLD